MPNTSFTFNKHFLDANILVGAWLEWDAQHNIVKKYIDCNSHERYTSKRAWMEARHVLEKYRRLVNNYLCKFEDDFGMDFNLNYIDREIARFNRKYLEGIANKSDKTKVESFIKDHLSEIKNCVLGAGSIELLLEDAVNKFKIALNTLDNECRNDHTSSIFKHETCPLKYESHYPFEKSELMKTVIYDNDVYIILDAYYIKETFVKSDMCLITTDYEHILSKKLDIERILVGINVESPELIHS